MSLAGEARRYDIAILGGGLGGLSLALHLARSPLRNQRILIVDKDDPREKDRNWGFWTERPTLFESAYRARWDRVRICDAGVDRTFDLAPFYYASLSGAGFHHFVEANLASLPNLDRITGVATGLRDGSEAATFTVNGEEICASWVFDSRFQIDDFNQPGTTEPFLLQHFQGWEVETLMTVFDPAVATLFDLRAPQPPGGIGFFYQLPFSPNRALIVYTLCSPGLLAKEAYRQGLASYMENELNAGEYSILEEEGGLIPLTSRRMTRKLGNRILSIGTLGGQVKPSTGFAFTRIQKDSEAIVQSLLRAGHPFDIPASPPRHRLYDAMLLDVLLHSPADAQRAFHLLFTRNPVSLMLRFLNEESSPWDELQVMASVPSIPFLKALYRRVRARSSQSRG